MRILFISNLFPDARRPTFGLHNGHLVRRLAARWPVSVVAPRPRLSAFLTRRGAGEGIACDEDAALSPVFPSVPYLPKIGSAVNHRLYAAWMAPAVRAACQARRADVVLAAWAYPDGCAAVRLAASLGLPCVVVVQGSDVNEYLDWPVRRGVILRHLRRAAGVITRSEALRQRLLQAGLPEARVVTIPNGVDAALFAPSADRQALRREFGLQSGERVVLFVGNLVSVKNPLAAVDAVARLTQSTGAGSWRLVILGEGPLRGAVQDRVAAHPGLSATLAGVCAPAAVARWMQAADVLCVPSRNEGIPNVIREALACGLPVVASRVGGIPEVLAGPPCGHLVDSTDAAVLSAALQDVAAHDDWRDACRQHALRFTWDETIRAYGEVLGAAMPAGAREKA